MAGRVVHVGDVFLAGFLLILTCGSNFRFAYAERGRLPVSWYDFAAFSHFVKVLEKR